MTREEESKLVKKIINVGQNLDKGVLFYSGAECDAIDIIKEIQAKAIEVMRSSLELPNQDKELNKLAKNMVEEKFKDYFDKNYVSGDGSEHIKDNKPRGVFTNIKKE